MEVFGDYAYYYNAFYGDKNYKEEAATVNSLIKKYNSNCKSLLNLGCGTGRHDVELHKLGYKVHGIDLSSDMIEIAKKNENSNLSFEVSDIRTYKSAEKYDAVISLFHVISYQNSNEDVISAFKVANDALKEKGNIFIFDAWYGGGVLSDKPTVRVKKVEDDENILIRNAQPVFHVDKNVVDVNYDVLIINKKDNTVSEIKETHPMRYFFRPEVELMLGLAGFRLIDCIDCNTLKETDFNSWTAYFIAERIG